MDNLCTFLLRKNHHRRLCGAFLILSLFIISIMWIAEISISVSPSSPIRQLIYRGLRGDRSNPTVINRQASQKKLRCNYHHVALMVASADDARQAGSMLKTLFYHRRILVHLHLIVNEIGHKIMKMLLDTWELSDVKYSFYKEEINKASIDLMKLRLMVKLLPSDVEQIVYVANDVRFLVDVSVLFREMARQFLASNVTLGLILTDSCEGMHKHRRRDCYSDKVTLCALNKFRRSRLLNSTLVESQSKSEIDSILQQNDIFSIPCSWGVILAADRNYSDCFQMHGDFVNALIQNDMETVFTNNPIVDEAQEDVMSVLSSEPLLNPHLGCRRPEVAKQTSNGTAGGNDRVCLNFRRIAQMKRRTHLYYYGHINLFKQTLQKVNPDEISLLTQLSMDRFQSLERMLKNWNGPAIVVFHITDLESLTLMKKIKLSSDLNNRKSTIYHVVYIRENYNPINYLRNVAVNSSTSPYWFLVDADFVPNPELYEHLKVSTVQHMAGPSNKTILVVPAFEMLKDLGDSIPRNKSELLKKISQKTVVGFRMDKSWNLGHKPTNFTKWMSAKNPYLVNFADCFEPYIVVKREVTARYNEVLLERMRDKIAFTRLLHGLGFHFVVIPRDFIIHIPHSLSPGTLRYDKEREFSRCGSVFIEAYRKELYKRFPDRKF